MGIMTVCSGKLRSLRKTVLIIGVALALFASGCILPKKHPDEKPPAKTGKVKR